MERQKRRKKSGAKMAGVKSTFVIGDTLLMTSFGDRDEAVSEKNVNIIGEVEDLRTPEAYSVKYTESEDIKIAKSKNNLRATIKSPFFNTEKNAKSPEGEAYRRRVAEHKAKIKAEYEKLVFGNTYDDNIHIQLISKILDIEKNFSIVMGNLSYAINNLSTEQNIEKPEDYLGTEEIRSSDEAVRRILPRYSYLYGYEITSNSDRKTRKNLTPGRIEAIKERIKLENEKIDLENIASLKKVLNVLAVIRTASVHGFDKNIQKDIKIPVLKYNLDTQNINGGGFAEAIQSPLSKKMIAVKADYLKNSVVNIKFLEETLACLADDPYQQKRNIIKEYFDFAILKRYKNLGFSLTVLREEMLRLYGMNFESKLNLRPRINSFCDYLLYDYFVNISSEDMTQLVEELRSAAGEGQKEEIYKKTADELKDRYQGAFEHISQFKEKNVKKLKQNTIVSSQQLSFPFEDSTRFDTTDFRIREKADLFCAMAYYITLFLDGKEINIFLTTLNNIFENIASFLGVMKRHAIECRFTDDFAMFEDAEYIAEKLKTVISLARMKKTLDVCSNQALSDAIAVLGTSTAHDDLDMRAYMDKYLFHTDEEEDERLQDRNLRNFLTTNVVQSRKFNYISRYCNLKEVPHFAKNKAVVTFVLKKMNDPTLIDRYYETVCPGAPKEKSYKEKLECLVSVVVDMNIDKLEKVNNAETFSHKGADDKSVKHRNVLRACVGLYLNVLYQVAKNLMNVNGRYTLAFAMTERDRLMERIEVRKKEDKDEYIALTNHYLETGLIKCATDRIKENMKKYHEDETKLQSIPGEAIKTNLPKYCSGSTRTFRNASAHMEMMLRAPIYAEDIAEVDSYYALYHYCMQKHLVWCQNKFNVSPSTQEMKDSLDAAVSHHTYSKDAIKILCLPFAYNYARYKALTVKELFDWTDYSRRK